MHALKFYIPLSDLDKHIKGKIRNAKFDKDCTFIPMNVSINENDFSIEITAVAISDNVIKTTDQNVRYKMGLD